MQTQFKNNHFTEMCSGSEEGSHFRLIDFEPLNYRLESNKEEEAGREDRAPQPSITYDEEIDCLTAKGARA